MTGYVRTAASRVEDERATIEAEREAFSAFAESVRETDPQTERSVETPNAALVSPSADVEQLRTIRDRYRETVMNVPGYEREYGESLRGNMAAEFGEDVATAVVDGRTFTPRLRDLLVGGAEAAATKRENLLEAIEDERDSLSDARRQFEIAAVPLEAPSDLELSEEPFETLADADRRSQRDERRYETLLSDRQNHIHRKTHRVRNADVPFLQEYLYRDFEFRFPVLREGLERIEQLRERRRIIARLIARLD